MSRRSRRRVGLVLSALFASQVVALPVGACALERDGGDPVPDGTTPVENPLAHVPASASHPEHAASPASHPDHGVAHEHDADGAQAPCVALSACGAAAVRAPDVTSQVAFTGRTEPRSPGALERPAAVFLGHVTPPPRI